MSSHRVTKTQPIERFGQRAPTADRVGSAWSTTCALCFVKLSRHKVTQINVRRLSTGRSGINVCAPCKDKHTARKAVPA